MLARLFPDRLFLDRLFLAHPRRLGETYFGHQRIAFGYAAGLLGAGLACAVHGLVPAWFESTGSAAVRRLHERMGAPDRGRRAGQETAMPARSTG